jgi:hypothetical protein
MEVVRCPLDLGLRALRTPMLSREKLDDCEMGCTGLVGLENVASMRNQYEFGARNTFDY